MISQNMISQNMISQNMIGFLRLVRLFKIPKFVENISDKKAKMWIQFVTLACYEDLELEIVVDDIHEYLTDSSFENEPPYARALCHAIEKYERSFSGCDDNIECCLSKFPYQ